MDSFKAQCLYVITIIFIPLICDHYLYVITGSGNIMQDAERIILNALALELKINSLNPQYMSTLDN